MMKHLIIQHILRKHVDLTLDFHHLLYLGQLLNVNTHKLFQFFHLLDCSIISSYINFLQIVKLFLYLQQLLEFFLIQKLNQLQNQNYLDKLMLSPMLILQELLHELMVFYHSFFLPPSF